MSARLVPNTVRERQLAASDPLVSAWVSANAGSGKTHVLTQRVISLLLQGEDPAKILCITFTKAAAANMATRVFDTLSEWTALDDAALDKRIREIGAEPSAAMRARARRLFALALETPGGLKVQTIHAFCTRLLHQFPFEADVAARFTVLDDVTERQLLEDLSLDVMLEGTASADSPLGRAIAIAIASGADQTLRDVLREAIGERDRIESWIGAAGSVEAATAQLAAALGIDPSDTIEAVESAIFTESLIVEAEWPGLTAVLGAGQASDIRQAERLSKLRQTVGTERFLNYLSVFCTEKYEPRDRVVTNAIRREHPNWAERLEREQQRVCALLDRRRAVMCCDRTGSLLTLAHAVIRRYRAEKERRGLLDYDDLIDHALTLFRKTSAAWVLYKLDLGVDHVLIDEAQDTSPKQWEIIQALTAEFAAGAGARPASRTIFAVGDEKQSIFSFQGAAPRLFDEKRKVFERAFVAAEKQWRNVRLQTSFRSGKAVLGTVDTVFGRPEAFRGLSADPVKTVHEDLPDAAPGLVDIWTLTRASEKRDLEGWDLPFDKTSEESPSIKLARRIARNVVLWMKAGTRAGDILILVRQRGTLFESIIRALKQENIAVAGADRLILTDHIAVMDLIALADALLLPQDDLALATVLKSPLFGFDDDDLYAIAWNRGKASLRAALLGKGSEKPIFAEAALRIEDLTDAAREQSPFTFYARLLGPGGGRKKILARLGPEANDALDEFLNLALEYERRETPSLQGFVAWLREAQAEIKRDMEIARDEVRVMTVHGAKGLEAHTVILADTTTPPAGHHPPRLIGLPVQGVEGLFWGVARREDTPVMTGARDNAISALQDEYRRLLYVAMTRAKERLVICGTAPGEKKVPDGCWYTLIDEALRSDTQDIEGEDGERIRRHKKSVTPVASQATDLRPPIIVLPPWLTRDAAAEPAPPIAITPSSADDDEWIAAAGAGGSDALLRGRLVHRLMQSLPDIAPEQRADAVRTYLARAGAPIDEPLRAEIATQVLRILNDVLFAAVFAPGSRAEVPVVGRLSGYKHGSLAVSGQVDRLVVTRDSVLIVDYKTNRDAPRGLDEAVAGHSGYIRQLALYRALLERIYPKHSIHAALLWTQVPNLMEIPGRILDAALAPVTSA